MSKISFLLGFVIGGVLISGVAYHTNGFTFKKDEEQDPITDDSSFVTKFDKNELNLRISNISKVGTTINKEYIYDLDEELEYKLITTDDKENTNIKVEIDSVNKKIIISCLNPFDVHTVLHINKKNDINVESIITLDYVKELLDVNISLDPIDNGYYELTVDTGFIIPTYSLFTIDKEYEFTFKSVDVYVTQHDESDELLNNLDSLIEDTIMNKSCLPTSEQVWYLTNNYEWHEYLMSLTNYTDGYFSAILCSDGISKFVERDFNIEVDSIWNFEQFYEGVDEVIPEIPNIDI